MANLTIVPNRPEWGLAQADYEDLVSALRDEGHDAWLQEPRDGEYGSGGIVTDLLVEVSIFLWEHVSEETIGAIVALAIRSTQAPIEAQAERRHLWAGR